MLCQLCQLQLSRVSYMLHFEIASCIAVLIIA